MTVDEAIEWGRHECSLNRIPVTVLVNEIVRLREAIKGAHVIVNEAKRRVDVEQGSKCRNSMNKTPCCDKAGQYNGFGSDGPLLFYCAVPTGCTCHD